MNVTIIQSDNRLVITTSKDIATVAKELMLLEEKTITFQETDLVHSFEIDSCSLIHAIGKIVTVEASVCIGKRIVIKTECLVKYNDGIIDLSDLICNYSGFKVETDATNSIIKPLLLEYVNQNYKPEIHQFYNE